MKYIALILTAALACSCAILGESTFSRTRNNTTYLGYGIVVTDAERTQAVGHIDMERTTESYRDIYDYIRGKVPGVLVQDGKILIRGISSINSSTDPLFVVDGTPMSDISWINPHDVKSIDVLKDSSSCALYGVRGANGVIVIRMK